MNSPTYNIRAYNGLKITDGTFTSRHGVISVGGGEALIEDGSYTIEFKAATTSNVLYVYGDTDLTINGGDFISDNTANKADSGAALLVSGSSASVEINGGTFVGMNGMVSGNANTVVNGGSFDTVWNYNHYDKIQTFVPVGKTITVAGVTYTKNENGEMVEVVNLPKAEVTRLEAMTLKAGEHRVWDGSLREGTEDIPLEIVMNFKTLETAEEVKYSPWKYWKVDFYLTLEDLAGDSVTADNCYLAGNYGEFGWIVIPTDGDVLENGVTYPVVKEYDANITYKQICDSVKNFTAAIHIDEAILNANPNMKVKLELKITDPEDENLQFTIGEPAIYTAGQLKGEPKAEVTRLEAMTLKAGEHKVWDGSLREGTEDRPLEIVMNFKALETAEEVKYSPWKYWKVDFYLTLEDLAGDSVTADNCYLAGNYGEFGWIVIPTDGDVLENGVTYPVVKEYDANITYKQICDSVKNFTAAIHIDEAILNANPNMKVKLELKITDPEDENLQFTIGEPAIYTVDDLKNKEEEPKEYVIYGSNMILDNSLAMNFYIVPRLVETTDKVVVKHIYTDGRADYVIEKEISEINQTLYSGMYRVTMDSIAAKEMSETIEITVYSADGKVKDYYEDSVRQYAMGRIEKSSDEEMRILAVDLLNYGAEAQKYFGYNVSDLANNQLTAEQQALATPEVAVEDNYSGAAPSYGSSLHLESNIALMSYFDRPEGDIDGMKAEIKFVNHLGNEIGATVQGSEFAKVTSGGAKLIGIKIPSLVLADMKQIINVKVYNADGSLYGEVDDSIESYIWFARNNNMSSEEVMNALAKVSTSAHNYLH